MLAGMRDLRVLLAMVVISSCCPPMQDETTTPVKKIVVAPPLPPPSEPPMPEPPPPGPPVARTVDVVDKQFGLQLPDPYRWMEGIHNAEHDTWLKAHGEHADKLLAALPKRADLLARLREIGLGVSAVFNVQLGGKRMFHASLPAGAQRAKMVVREADGTSRVLLDPEALGTDVSLNAWTVSPDGTHVSYVISRGGGERGELHVMDVATGKDLADVIPRIWGEGAGNWLPDGKRFFYTQLAEPKEGVDPMTNMVARLHVVGQPVDKDLVVLGRDATATLKLAPEEWPGVWVPRGSTWMIASIGGARPESRIAVAKLSELDTTGASKTPWRIVGGYDDRIEGAFARGERLYILTSKDAPNRRVLGMPLAKPELAKATIEIAEDPDAAVSWFYPARDALYVLYMDKGLARMSRWPWKGTLETLALPLQGWIPDVASQLDRDGITFQIETWLKTGTYFAYDPKTKKTTPGNLASTTTLDTSGLVAEEVEATSADGTKVPLSILTRADRKGAQPAIVFGYAGYGVSQNPGFGASRLAWVERGGVLGICHARGGGEKGRKWHDGGAKTHKLKGVQDFNACGQYLVDKGYTTSAKLGAIGISMGGVLVGRALTERPDLYAAVWLGAPIVNPLRIMHAENGANQKGELGDPETEAGYTSIAAMDPYANVKPNTAYPAVIFTVGVNDHRVAPWMASKMASRLMTSSTSKRPILLRVDGAAGHGIGNSRDQVFEERADIYAFFLQQFGE